MVDQDDGNGAYQAVVAHQVEALRTLSQPEERREWLQDLARRRRERRVEGADPDAPGSGFPMVPVALVEVEGRSRNHCGLVPVVADEVVVRFTTSNRGRAADLLTRAGFASADADLPDDARCCADYERFVGDPDKVGSLLLRLRSERILANHGAIVALADTVKGPNDPKPAGNSRLQDFVVAEAGEDAPVVVVIDTGLEPSTHRGGWLHDSDVTALDETADIDPVNAINNLTGATAPDRYIDPAAGHGTFVAGMIRRVAPTAKVVMVRAIDSEGFASDAMVAAAICRAATYFGEDGRGVVNLSIGGETVDNLIPPVIECALRRLPEQVVVVAAAGNEPTGVPVWPAASKRVISVAALDVDERPADWSNFGSTVDFSVCGEGLVSTFVPGIDPDGDEYGPDDYGIWSGTSFAAPQVAAALAQRMADGSTAAAAVQSLRADGEYTPGRGYVLRSGDVVLEGGAA